MTSFSKIPMLMVLALSLVLSGILISAKTQPSEQKMTVKPNSKSETGIQWLTFEEALVLQEKEPRMWLIDCWTDWCGWCKRMEATTFSDPIIGEFVNKNYYAVSFNAEQKEDIIVHGRTYKFVNKGQRGYHELAAELMQGKMSYPTVVFLNDKMEIFQALPGYQTKENFLPIVHYFHSYDPAAPVRWEDYQKTFKSPYPTETNSGQ